MPHICVRRFDVTGIVEIFLGTKQGLISIYVLRLHSKCLIFFLNTKVHSFSVYPREKKAQRYLRGSVALTLLEKFFGKHC